MSYYFLQNKFSLCEWKTHKHITYTEIPKEESYLTHGICRPSFARNFDYFVAFICHSDSHYFLNVSVSPDVPVENAYTKKLR